MRPSMFLLTGVFSARPQKSRKITAKARKGLQRAFHRSAASRSPVRRSRLSFAFARV